MTMQARETLAARRLLDPLLIATALLIAGRCPLIAQNLVLNGDFEQSSLAGISSDYLHTPQGNTVEGSWWVSPWDPGGPWHNSQHTPGGVGAMSANGDDSGQAGVKRVWFQAVSVQPGLHYDFSTWALGTHAGPTGYSLKFAFDGVQVGSVVSPTSANTWEEFSATVVPSTSITIISIVNVSGITFPNDFMLDDISLTPSSSTTTYCTPGTTSNGCVPSIAGLGTPDIGSTSGFEITATNIEGQRAGLCFYGINGRIAGPWFGGTSFLCVKAPTQRMTAQNSGGTAGQCNGVLAEDWLAYLASHPSALGHPFQAGQVVNAQVWFRDPQAPGTTNLSGGLEFTLAP
jgi:hypothetical protein